MAGAWLANLFALPGNWLIVALAAIFAFTFPVSAGRGIHWATVGVGVGLAIVGELVELAAGAAGRGRQAPAAGPWCWPCSARWSAACWARSWRSPFPSSDRSSGPWAAGALGAFAGAYIGETAIGRSTEQSLAAGKGAMIGRLLGTASKLVIGVVLFVVVAVDALI